jgi:hypothetical protein
LSEAGQKLSPAKRTNWFKQNSLGRSFRPGKCLICSNLIASERRAIHSFLHEGMMAPEPRAVFLRGGGFCLRHFWIAKRIEEECWPAGGIGVAILCENLLEGFSPPVPPRKQRGSRLSASHQKNGELRSPGFACTFCRDNRERERALLEELNDLVTESEWSKTLTDAPLCLSHTWLAFRFWRGERARAWIDAYFRSRREQLVADVREFIRKRDWQYRNDQGGSEQHAVPSAIEFLVGLVDQFPEKLPRELVKSQAAGEVGSSPEPAEGRRHAQ